MTEPLNTPGRVIKGRGATVSPNARYLRESRERAVDAAYGDESVAPITHWRKDVSRSVLTFNKSPDVGFDRSVNPYRGCEHGCVYCFARPTHAYLDLSPGLDFETQLFYKPDAVAQLRKALLTPRYKPAPIALGINTDAYQPGERRWMITRQLIQLLIELRHPFSIITKSALIERDIDLLAQAAKLNLVFVAFSITTLDGALARKLEPRAASPSRRLQAMGAISAAGVPTLAMVAPVIPALTDHELETILGHAKEAGARDAAYVLLRLPLEVEPLFRQWLQDFEPNKLNRVLNRVREMRGGKLYQSQFHARMSGEGIHADLLSKRFKLAKKRLGFVPMPTLDCSQFQSGPAEAQLSLW